MWNPKPNKHGRFTIIRRKKCQKWKFISPCENRPWTNPILSICSHTISIFFPSHFRFNQSKTPLTNPDNSHVSGYTTHESGQTYHKLGHGAHKSGHGLANPATARRHLWIRRRCSWIRSWRDRYSWIQRRLSPYNTNARPMQTRRIG